MFFVCTMLSFNPLSSMYEVLYDADGERATEPLDVGDKNDPNEEEQTMWMRQTIRMNRFLNKYRLRKTACAAAQRERDSVRLLEAPPRLVC